MWLITHRNVDDAGMDAVVNICARLKSNMDTSMLSLFDVFNTNCSPRRMEQLGEELKAF